MARFRAIRWLAAGVFALAPAVEAAAQAAPEPGSDSMAETPIAQSEYTLPLLPKVTCDHNQLAIEADNATLISVLSAVESCLGVPIKPPSGFRDERTFTHLGPGQADRVLDELLGSLDLNYAIVLSGAAGRRITSVVLTSRVADNAEEPGERSSPAARDVPMTSARRLWMASQTTSGRPTASASDAAEESPKLPATAASRGIPESLNPGAGTVPQALEGAGAGGQANGSSSVAASAGKEDPATSANTAQAAASSTTSAVSSSQAAPAITPPASDVSTGDGKPAANALGQQINQMQQMFEQRRKLNAPPPAPSPDPQP